MRSNACGALVESLAECHTPLVTMTITLECAEVMNGRWRAEVPQMPGVHAYGSTRDAAAERALAVVYRVLDEARRLGMLRTETADVFGRQSERNPTPRAHEPLSS